MPDLLMNQPHACLVLIVAETAPPPELLQSLQAHGYRLHQADSLPGGDLRLVPDPDLVVLLAETTSPAWVLARLREAEEARLHALVLTAHESLVQLLEPAGIWVLQTPFVMREFDLVVRATRMNTMMQHKLALLTHLAGLGALAGNVAHEFNNILTSISGNTGLALLDILPESPPYDSLNAVQGSVRQANQITRQLLLLAGRGGHTATAVDIGRFVRELGPLLKLIVGKRAEYRGEIDDKPILVVVESGNLRRIIVAVVIDAAASVGSGYVMLRCTTDATHCMLEITCRPQPFADDLDLGSVFEPYAELRGLGLIAAFTLCQQIGASIRTVRNAPNGWSVFVSVPQQPYDQ